MALVIVASALPMAVLCTSTPAQPGMEPDYAVELVGERDPSAINGVGLTYDVDDAAFGEWIALNVDLADSVKIVTQAEIDAWADATDQYGFELGLEQGGTLATEGMFPTLDLPNPAERLRTAAQRHRVAEMNLRQAETMRAQAEALAEAARLERDTSAEAAAAAADAAREHDEAVAARQPPPPERRADDPRPRAEA